MIPPGDGYIWSADFKFPGEYDNEQTLFDIVGNTWVNSQQVDDDGDKTMFGQNTPSFVVFPEWEWFDGNNWPDEGNPIEDRCRPVSRNVPSNERK